jgi:hypothetical protein
MNEAETRAEHIDPTLKAAGSCVGEGSRVRTTFQDKRGLIVLDQGRTLAPLRLVNHPGPLA